VVLFEWKRDAYRQQVLRSESRIDRLQPSETLDEQSRAHEQHEGQRNLRDYEQTAQPGRSRAAANVLAALLQRVLKIDSRRFDRGREAENDSRDHRQREGESQHLAVDADTL